MKPLSPTEVFSKPTEGGNKAIKQINDILCDEGKIKKAYDYASDSVTVNLDFNLHQLEQKHVRTAMMKAGWSHVRFGDVTCNKVVTTRVHISL